MKLLQKRLIKKRGYAKSFAAAFLSAAAAVMMTCSDHRNPLWLDIDETPFALGIVNKDGEFVVKEGFDAIPFIVEAEDIPLFAKTNLSRVLQLKMSKNKHNSDVESLYLNARWINGDGRYLSGSSDVRIDMVKTYEDGNDMYFLSNKRILFCLDGLFQGLHNDVYIIMLSEEGYLNLTIPRNQ